MLYCSGEQGWRSGESTRLSPMWPGFNSRRRRHLWVEFVVSSLLCSERFFSGYSGFPLSSKTSIAKLQFGQESGRQRTTMLMCYLQIVIIFIYLLYVKGAKRHNLQTLTKNSLTAPKVKIKLTWKSKKLDHFVW